MVEDKEIDARVARLARSGRARDFSAARFRAALAAAAAGTSRNALLRRLLAEWSGITVEDEEAEAIWQHVERLHALLRRTLGPPVSLQTALLHEVHSKRGLLQEPRVVSERDLTTLRGNAITDPLTGLYNRRFLHDHLEREI